MPPSQKTLTKFSDIVGAANVLHEESEMAPYLREWRDKYFGRAAAVVRPKSADEVSELLKVANNTRTAIVPQGGNTGLVGGQIPFETGDEVVLSLARMNKIVDVDPVGNTMTVEAGVLLQDIQGAADRENRLFPLSLAAEGSCQIGGNLATNAGGVAVLAYGNARDLTLGLEVVLADGRIWNGLKRLRKDNSGYDLRDLFIGSEGTLGIITGAVLKLFPKPAQKITAFVALQSLEGVAHAFSISSEKLGPKLTAFELLPRIGVEFVMRHLNGRDPFDTKYPWYVLIEISEHDPCADGMRSTETLLEHLLADEIISDAVVASSLAQSQTLWKLRESLSEVQIQEGGSIKHDVSVPTAKIPAFIRGADAIVENMIPRARPVPFGHFGDGNIHYNVSQPERMDKQVFLAKWEDLNAAVYEFALTLGGSISAEHGIGRMKRDFLQQTKDPAALWMMHSIKRSLDPNGILNPGKVLSL